MKVIEILVSNTSSGGNMSTAVAKAFAAHELQISEDQMHLTKWTTGHNPHIAETVVLQILNGPCVDVEFGSDNLPAKVTLVPKPQVA